MRLAATQYRRAAAEPLRQAEAMIPEGTPVVMPALKAASKQIGDATPLRPMSISGRLEDQLDQAPPPLQVTFQGRTMTPANSTGGNVSKFMETWGQLMDPASRAAVTKGLSGGTVSFQEARAIESELGDLARRQQGMGDRPDRMLKYLHQAAKDDVNAFASSDQAPAGFLKTLDDARLHYAKANQFLDRGVDRALRSDDPAAITDKMFSPHQDPETLDFFKQNLPAKQYNQALTVWLGSMFQAAKHGTDNFLPQKFASQLAPYIESGAIDHMLPSKTADALKNVYARYQEMPGLKSETPSFIGTLEPARIVLAGVSLAKGSMLGVNGIAAMIGAPLAISKVTTSPAVVNMLLKGIPTRAVSDNALRAAAQIVGGSISLDNRPDPAPDTGPTGRPPISLIAGQ
jgi:hypothetical protein